MWRTQLEYFTQMTGPSPQQLLHSGLAHHRAGRLGDAEAAYRQVLSQRPNNPDALHLLGVLIHQAGRNDEAALMVERAIALRPGEAVYLNNLGLILMAQEKWELAIAALQRAMTLNAGYVEAQHNLGVALMAAGRVAEAATALRRAVALRPDHADAQFNLGRALCKIGPLEEAVAACRRAVDLRPDRAEGWTNLGVALLKTGRQGEAETCQREAIRRNPNLASAWHKLAGVLMAMGRLDEAEAACRQACALQPSRPEALGTLANILKDQGRIDEAIAGYRRSIARAPQLYPDYGSLLYSLHFHPGYDTRAIFHEHCLWNAVQARAVEKQARPHGNDRSPERPLRIGYVSPHFRNQATSFFTLPLLGAHDKSQFEIYCYADVLRRDEVTALLQQQATVWRDIVGLPDEQVAAMIREDKIDVLVDLTMHMAEGRPLLFARKPAPVQVAWLAYPGTTGLTTMDYRLTDPHLDPVDALTQSGTVDALSSAARWQAAGLVGSAPRTVFSGGGASVRGELENLSGNSAAGALTGGNAVLRTAGEGTGGTLVRGADPTRIGPGYLAEDEPFAAGGRQGLNDDYYSETSYRLPDTALCYNPMTGQPPVNSLPALQSGQITFGSLNHFAKANDMVLKMWAAALAAVPHSRMLVLAPQGSHRQRLENAVRAAGGDPRQVEYLDRQPRQQYLEFYHRIDIVLDTFPYNGETTSLDGLWMGVPMVTLCGTTAPSRAGLGFLSHLGLADLVAKSSEEFPRIAARLAGNLPRLVEMRRTLRAAMESSPLMDAPRFARNVEAAYRWMWQRWIESCE
jgi:predicted O-linked N-acetylglucosamine transferase (SPINDLY family)